MHKILSFLLIALFAFACTTADDAPEPDKPSKSGTISLSGKYDFDSYYKNIDGIDSRDLKDELHDLIDGNKVLGYSYGTSVTVWDALERTDEDPKNSSNIILLYTGRSIPKWEKSKNLQPDYWNREHVWVKSRGFGGDPRTIKGPSTDIHHIRPTDTSVNSDRYTKYFDEGGSQHNEATECKYTSKTWEPRNAVKGDVARMMFYMAVRYEGDDGFNDLELSNSIPSSGGSNMGKLSTLLEWHKQDPVDAFEKKRNQTIFEIQGNRNPFIDHPEFVAYIW